MKINNKVKNNMKKEENIFSLDDFKFLWEENDSENDKENTAIALLDSMVLKGFNLHSQILLKKMDIYLSPIQLVLYYENLYAFKVLYKKGFYSDLILEDKISIIHWMITKEISISYTEEFKILLNELTAKELLDALVDKELHENINMIYSKEYHIKIQESFLIALSVLLAKPIEKLTLIKDSINHCVELVSSACIMGGKYNNSIYLQVVELVKLSTQNPLKPWFSYIAEQEFIIKLLQSIPLILKIQCFSLEAHYIKIYKQLSDVNRSSVISALMKEEISMSMAERLLQNNAYEHFEKSPYDPEYIAEKSYFSSSF